MPADDYGPILAGVVGLLQAAGFNAAARKVPVVLKTDTLPITLVCPRAETEEGYVSEGSVLVGYPVLVVWVAAGNQNYSAGMTAALAARHSIWESVRVLSIAGTGVYDYGLSFSPVFDESALVSGNYDYSALEITYTSDVP